MFYSQFILAKKGPLGTIWIAAHLERKLRKNQVADTDIGVSVDSILFPDVPIALRLSSHLLLGVVRIYSRKVNYLFDDCSEALLKVKQAFRSTAVDLPPEESTAPYHSITLPETFDLDDFELPDNDIFQGNYVDHHISTREQITLQDTMEGVVYSTSQFGLDERFGDGETSQAGLDLEEELLLDKAAVKGHDEVSENDAQACVRPMPHPDIYVNHERMTESSDDMPLNGTTNKIPDLGEASEAVDYADAPCTPGLVEPNVTSVMEGLACDDHLESEEHSMRELTGNTDNITGKSNVNHREDAMELNLGENVNDTLVCMPSVDHHFSDELESNQTAPEVELLSTAVTTEQFAADESVCSPLELAKVEDKVEVASCNNEHTMSAIDQVNGNFEVLGVRSQEADNVETGPDVEVPHSNGNATITTFQSLELSCAQECVNVESQECQGLVNCELLKYHDNNNNDQTLSTSSEMDLVDVEPLLLNTAQREDGHVFENSTKLQGEEFQAFGGIQSEEIKISEKTVNGETLEDGGKQDNELDDVMSQREDLSTSMTSEFSAPEKLLSAPQRLLDEPHDMLTETPGKRVQEEGGGSEAGSKITGYKRSFTDSALTMRSLNSVDSLVVARSKETVESIPDDDDLLSSILVGRKSSVMKIKPSPPAPEPPSKRARSSASRPIALKRKVLMDESMVLHGDTIRQQLTNTEDIRRLRKKAPCTHTEILMIQRQFLEVDIFYGPVLTGMSVELTHLHNEAFDLSRVRVCENDDNIQASVELIGVENSPWKNVKEGGEMELRVDVITSANHSDGELSEFPAKNGIQQVEDQLGSHDMSCQDDRNCIAEEMDFRSSVQANLGELVEMEGYKENFGIGVATNSAAMGVETLQSELVSNEISKMPSGTIDQSAHAADIVQMDTPILLGDNIDVQLREEVPFVHDTSNVVALEDIEAVDQSVDRTVSDRAELRTEEEVSMEETQISALDEGNASALNDRTGASLANVSSFKGDCCNLNSVNVGQTLEDTENGKSIVCNDGKGQVVSSGCIVDKDQNSNPLCHDESKMDTCSVGLEGDVKNTSINHHEHATGQESDFHDFTNIHDSFDQVTCGDCDDIQGAPFANDTDFLNVDDDEMGEDDDEGMPNTEDSRLLENTGWSSRTRAVARYLQTLFDKEAEHGRKGVSMDNLLAGKTRKEASRMFFETLVLKTRDYVQVEQPHPFDNINIKPRSMLMKSDF